MPVRGRSGAPTGEGRKEAAEEQWEGLEREPGARTSGAMAKGSVAWRVTMQALCSDLGTVLVPLLDKDRDLFRLWFSPL